MRKQGWEWGSWGALQRWGRTLTLEEGVISRQAVTLPWLVYWPSATSRKNTGMPQEEEDEVGDEEGSCRERGGGLSLQPPLASPHPQPPEAQGSFLLF